MSKFHVELEDIGGDMEDHTLLKVYHNGHLILAQSDGNEPEDQSFGRGLCWVPDIIEEVYRRGFKDGAGWTEEGGGAI